ncbi:DUF6929 family protein [Sandaracinus amylolyticus]|uniref:DUF6929 family protein n=1 Tax=Sandaracinus amylolyticus TaxID=927083 RepID=UPI001F2FE781|nr:hypothetical protein [Sandaracinus amylolyticus]UJR80852.1 Hypothetical protein I5071_29020 [Sandaracinus amylolyticus]
MTERRVARLDPSMRAVVRTQRELFYDAGADPSLDRPAHVRSGSGLAWLGSRLVIAQDDASFLALLDASLAHVSSITLDHVVDGARQFDNVRGNKKQKIDLEACSVLACDGRELLVAWGSGSLAPRERLVVLERDADRARVVEARPLYEHLREHVEFAGSEMNIEGATMIGGDRVRLFQRGNGAPHGDLVPLDATGDLDLRALLAWIDDPTRAVPALRDVVQWDLGRMDGVRLTFTDACPAPNGSIAYLAAAEASPDAIEDGVVVGVAIGVIDAHGVARYAPITTPDGVPFVGKCEGLAWAPGAAGRRALVVVDRDDPNAPSELLELDLEGFPEGS